MSDQIELKPGMIVKNKKSGQIAQVRYDPQVPHIVYTKKIQTRVGVFYIDSQNRYIYTFWAKGNIRVLRSDEYLHLESYNKIVKRRRTR